MIVFIVNQMRLLWKWKSLNQCWVLKAITSEYSWDFRTSEIVFYWIEITDNSFLRFEIEQQSKYLSFNQSKHETCMIMFRSNFFIQHLCFPLSTTAIISITHIMPSGSMFCNELNAAASAHSISFYDRYLSNTTSLSLSTFV